MSAPSPQGEVIELRAKKLARQLERNYKGVRYHFLVSVVRRSLETGHSSREGKLVDEAKALQRRVGETYRRQARARGDFDAVRQIEQDHFLPAAERKAA